MNEDYKSITKTAYDKYASIFDTKFEEHFQKRVHKKADNFIKNLQGSKILDVGCGSGNHALYFKNQGLDVTCVDISEAMIDICKKKGLKALVADVEDLDLNEKFDGVWAYAVLLHLPKERISEALGSLIKHLKPGGLISVALKEGRGEGFETHHKYPDTKRWFTYFTAEEIKNLFDKNKFDLLYEGKENVENKFNFLEYVYRLKA